MPSGLMLITLLNWKKLPAATLVETIVALLILVISFSSGMMIYSRVMVAGVNDAKLRAQGEMMHIADSLALCGADENQTIAGSGFRCKVYFTVDSIYSKLNKMQIQCTDETGRLLSEETRLINADAHEEI